MRTELCIKKPGELRRILDIKLEKLAGVSQSKLKACPGFKVSLVSVHMGDVPHVKNMIARYDIVETFHISLPQIVAAKYV